MDKIEVYHLEEKFNILDRNKIETYFLESPIHPNVWGYELTADYIVEILQRKYRAPWEKYAAIDSGYVYEVDNIFLEYNEELENYIEEITAIASQESGQGVCGSIVMNCNPLTYGHKYLIEYATKMVDYLYIFVVQEDKSMFSFKERFEMVNLCVAEYPNVIVLPSGKFIISTFAFPGYFVKQEKNLSMAIDTSEDVVIFGKYIAPSLNITVRFAEEEPVDYVTKQYNQTMERLLPKYGVKFIEIPRYEVNDLGIVSASKVRDALSKREYDIVEKLVPKTTYQFMKKGHYLHCF